MKATIYKADLQISDMNRHYYEQHSLTLAQHLDESEQFLMTRILAFALFADEGLTYTKGFYELSEPTLWKKNYSGDIELWIDLGCPDEKRIKKACSASEKVVIFSATDKTASWWNQIKSRLTHQKNLQVVTLPIDKIEELTKQLSRTMQMQVTIEGTHLWVSINETMTELTPEILMGESLNIA